jgi:hypothetical protein
MWKDTLNSFFATRLLSDITTYYNLYDFLKIKFKENTNGKIVIKDEADFWRRILKESFKGNQAEKSLQNGDILSFSNFFLTDWTPKTPGALWTKEGDELAHRHHDDTKLLKIQDKYYPVFHPSAKERKLKAGYGSVRVNPSESENQTVLMSLVGPDFWSIDYGIPVVVAKSVYEEFLKKSKRGAVWIENAEGVLSLNKKLPVKNFIQSAIGYEISKKTETELTKIPHLPSCFVNFPTTMSMKMIENYTHPLTTAWTMFKSNHNYGLTFWQFDPYEKNSFKEVTNCLTEYVKNFGGEEILTDFDGLIPRLNSKIPLKTNPLEKNLSDYEKIVKDMDRE